MANGIRTGDPRGFNKGRSSKFREGSRVQQTQFYSPSRQGKLVFDMNNWNLIFVYNLFVLDLNS